MRIAILAAVMAVTGFSSAALAEGKKIGVSWAQFQEERWKIDEAAMKAAIEAAALASEAFTRHAAGAQPKKVIVVPNRLVNVVV